jgi:uncharacterized phage protein gp47/JayE
MQLQLQDFTTLVRNMAASVQGGATTLIDLTTGSILRAILEANASVALWLQWLIVLVLGQTRAATSNGADLDTWVNDFSLTRLPGQAAQTTVTFSRITPGYVASIPVGTQVKTSDGTQTFAVLADTTNPAYVPATASYTLAAAATSIALTVQATTQGAAGNVQPGIIDMLASAIPGVDTVTNPLQAQGGLDAEPDAALRARFANFIDSRSRATPAAIAFTIDSLQQGLSHVVTENISPSGASAPGTFIVTINDGSGAPPAALISAVATAVDTVRPVGTQFFVQPPQNFLANVSLTITLSDNNKPTAQASVTSAITAYIAALPLGAPLPITRVAALAYAAAANITNVATITINGAAADLIPTATGIVMPGLIAVN